MKRPRFFEFEDQPWLPVELRNLQTDCLRAMGSALQPYKPAVPLLKRMLAQVRCGCIVDLCSGAGGPWARLVEQGWDVKVILTDRFPNHEAMASLHSQFPQHIEYRTESVDARHLPAGLVGMRVMFNSFHHFCPDDAKAILRDAAACNEAIAIFEIAERTPTVLFAALLGVPLLAWTLTPWIRPVRFSRLFWTYCVPLVPACLLWDGLVSIFRAYTPAELNELTAAVDRDDYLWETGRITSSRPGLALTYLLGYPRAR